MKKKGDSVPVDVKFIGKTEFEEKHWYGMPFQQKVDTGINTTKAALYFPSFDGTTKAALYFPSFDGVSAADSTSRITLPKPNTQSRVPYYSVDVSKTRGQRIYLLTTSPKTTAQEYKFCCPITELSLSPAQVLMSRSLHTKIPVCDRKLKPKKNNNNQITDRKYKKKEKDYYDRNAKSRAEFKRGEDVVLRKEKEWVPAKIEEKLDYPRSYLVKDEDGKVYRRNSVFLRKSVNQPNFRGIDKELDEAGKKGEEQVDDRDQEEVNKKIANQRQEIVIENRGEREKRERKLPSRFKDYKLY
ncbi:hypothetical protein QE152_g13534 [Popillia japonica]|uniref:Uncharacterized protein n=1 Tax=Popillia japonica TaxID=7064 RepID=A0AAW1L982_POPJA